MKVLKWVLIALGLVFAFYLGRAMLGGFSESFAPNQMVEQARQKAAENEAK